jgi:sulfatase maturation enzyme AslB (radical SAM superfamily)
MKLLLNEIIWEITTHCDNNCSYCGSKEGWGESLDPKGIRSIVDEIAKYPPNEINISGGDPLTVDFDTHKYVVESFKAKGVLCKILVNPKSLSRANASVILSLYDHVGVSINTQEELDIFTKSRDFLDDSFVALESYTVITNFNIYNSYMAKSIASGIPKDTIWQIQFTMYKDMEAKGGLWNHPIALKQLNVALGTIDHLKMVIADNGNSGACAAGINSIGLLANGDIVPCLSYRAWVDDIALEVESNILKTPLKDVWFTKFQSQRFEDYKCCKDVCAKKLIKPVAPVRTLDEMSPVKFPWVPPFPFPNITEIDPVQAYAVTAYGVQSSFPHQQSPTTTTLGRHAYPSTAKGKCDAD